MFFALLIRSNFPKAARPMQGEIRGAMFLIACIDERRPALGPVGLTKEFAPHSPVCTFGQGVIGGLAGAGFRAFDQAHAQERGHVPLDGFRTIIGLGHPGCGTETRPTAV